MKIAVDLRSLQSGTVSGVENYTINLLGNLLALDRTNEYILFYNSLGKTILPDFHYVNSKVRLTRYPNKLLNFALKLGAVKLERLMGEFDWLFMPNLNQFSISPGAKLAITVHDLSPIVSPEYYNFRRKLWHKFLNYQKAFKRANILFAVSEHTKQDLIRVFNLPPEKIKVIYPGIDSGLFHPSISADKLRHVRNIYGLPGQYVLFLNTIEPRKNLAGAVKAFEKIDGPEFLIIAGRQGWKWRGDFKLVRQSKKSAKIKYIGYIEETDKPALIKMAKVLIYPSFYEGFGFQPLEAMALGTPVVASAVSSQPEVIAEAGLLINPHNPASLADGLNLALNNNNLRVKLIAKGLARAEQFSWEVSARQIVSCF